MGTPRSKRTRGKRNVPKHNFTIDELQIVHDLYPVTPMDELVVMIFGRSDWRYRQSLHNLASRLGLSRIKRWSRETYKRIGQLHAQGLTDVDIARQLQLDRRSVNAARLRGLGLPCNEEAVKRALRQSPITQARTLGIKPGGQLRVLAFRRFATQSGWPADLRPRAVQILNALARNGPRTRRQLADDIGMPWKGSKKSLISNDKPGGTYLTNLKARGLVMRLGRLVRHQGPGSGQSRNVNLYALTPLAIDLLARRKETAS